MCVYKELNCTSNQKNKKVCDSVNSVQMALPPLIYLASGHLWAAVLGSGSCEQEWAYLEFLT